MGIIQEENKKYALITGSAKGIGRSIARELAFRGYSLLLTDLDEDALQQTAADLTVEFSELNIHYFVHDLSDVANLDKIVTWSEPFHTQLKVVVNNAGFGLNGTFENLSLDEQLQIIDVNLKALIKLTYLFLPILNKAERTYLLNVASTAAYQAVPYFTVYSASKAAVLSFNRALRYELRNTKITLTNLSPGSTDTHFVHRARMGSALKKLAQKLNMSPDDVAKTAVKGLFAGRSEIIPGFINVLNAYLPRFVPKVLTESVGAKIYKPELT